MDLEYKKDFLSIEMEDQGAMELSDQEEEQLVDRGCIALLWQSLEEQQGLRAHSLLHLSVETSKQEVSRDRDKLSYNHSEPDSIQDID